MLDLALQNRAKKQQKSVPRSFQEPLGTDVCFSRTLKLHFERFWPPTWAQHGPINPSNINQNPPEWPPGADLAAKRPPDPSRRPSWPLRGSILAPPGAFFLSFRCFWASLPGSKRKRKRKAQDATRKRKRNSKPELLQFRSPRSLEPWVAAGGREAIKIVIN